MNMLIDIILVIAFAYFVYKYSKSGLLVAVLGIGKPFASLMFALLLGKPMSDLAFSLLSGNVNVPILPLRIISSLFSYSTIFVVSFAVISIAINIISDIKIPVISQIDRSLGALFGLFVWISFASMIASCAFSALAAFHGLIGNAEIMNIYNDSIIFKTVYNLNFFGFVKKLI
jgi:hypothetical protein